MIASNYLHSSAAQQPVAVSSAGGGQSPQYRVQYHTDEACPWRMYALFRHREQAEECAADLEKRGYAARIVKYGICPSAA